MVEHTPPGRRLRHVLGCVRGHRTRSSVPPLVSCQCLAATIGELRLDEDGRAALLARIASGFTGSPGVELSFFPSSPATTLAAGLKLFHPADTQRWLTQWKAERPMDGDPLQALQAPAGETFKKAPLVIQPASSAQATPAFLAAWCRTHRRALAQATDVCGALLFRGFGLGGPAVDSEPILSDFEGVMEGLGTRTSDFLGTAPRAKVGKYIVKNVSFEPKAPEDMVSGAASVGHVVTGGPMDALRAEAGMVWAEHNSQFFNFHNELAYMDAEHHRKLGLANYAFFSCTQAPDAGGYTILSDTRRVHNKLEASLGNLPAAFKFVIARKSLRPDTPRALTGDYESFLCGDWEFEQHTDQWSPGGLATREADIARRCEQLGLQYTIDGVRHDIEISSGWVSPSRLYEPTGEKTWWCNVNHAVLGKGHPLLPFWFRGGDGANDEGGKGREASWSELFAMVAAYWSEATFFDWQVGDLLLLHNQLVAHNASPGLGQRSIMPVFGDCFCDE